jgi:hypothetical protein
MSRTAKFLPTFDWVKDIARDFNWLKCLGGIMHIRPTAGCQRPILICENKLWRWARTLPSLTYFYWIFLEIPLQNLFSNIKVDIWHPAVGPRGIFPPRHLSQFIALDFNWLKCLGGIMHLRPTGGCQIPTLIFENKLWRGVSVNMP